jgi:hypothetical protein
LINAILAALSLASLLFQAFVEPSNAARAFFDAYEGIVALAFSLFSPLLEYVRRFVAIDLHWWRHTTFILILYFSLDVRIGYLSRQDRKAPPGAIVSTIIIGIVCGISAGLAGGYFAAVGSERAAALSPMAGYATYELATAPFTARWMPAAGLSRAKSYIYYSIAYGVVGFLLGLTSIALVRLWFPDDPDAMVLSLIVFSFLIAIRNLVMSWVRTFWFHPDHANWRHHFFITGSFPLAVALLRALLVLLVIILVDAGAALVED